MSILIENLSKNFGTFKALDHVNLEIKTGSLVALVGPSGSGKSTLLRIIAGLDIPNSGRIWLSGKNATFLSIQEREIGFVFQNYALFKHMTVYENIAFGLDIRNIDSFVILNRVNQLLQLIQLEKFSYRYPNQLSGGQQQRVAIARALIIQPKVLLLDEPTSALDVGRATHLLQILTQLATTHQTTILMVNHQLELAQAVCTRVLHLQQGQLIQDAPNLTVDWAKLREALIQAEAALAEEWIDDTNT